MTPGPIEVHQSVLDAASHPVVSHLDPELVASLGRTYESARNAALSLLPTLTGLELVLGELGYPSPPGTAVATFLSAFELQGVRGDAIV